MTQFFKVKIKLVDKKFASCTNICPSRTFSSLPLLVASATTVMKAEVKSLIRTSM